MPSGSGSKKRRRNEVEGDEEQEEYGMGNQTLPVAILSDDFDGIPIDGAQYLAVVRREAKAAPSIVRDKRYSFFEGEGLERKNAKTATESSSNDLLPSQEWREQFTQKFKNMRQSIKQDPASDHGIAHTAFPNNENAVKWFKFLHGIDPNRGEADKDNHERDQTRNSTHTALRPPKSSLLRQFQLVNIMTLLSNFTIWLDEDWYVPKVQGTNRPSIEPFHSQWLFSLLAYLDQNLVGDDVSTLRQLSRSCIFRITRSRQERSNKGNALLDMEIEQGAWIIICAVIEVWGQKDLWHDAKMALQGLP